MKKAHMCIILSGERLKDFSVKSEINQWCPLSPLHFNTIMEARSEQLYKMNNEKLQNGREEEIVYLYMTYLIAITPKNKKKKLLCGIRTFSKRYGQRRPTRMDQWNTTENQGIHTRRVSCFQIRNQDHSLRQNQCLLQLVWGDQISAYKRVESEHYLTPRKQVNSKRIKELNWRAQTPAVS